MNWTLKFLPEAEKDLKKLDGNERLLVAKAIKKVLQKPASLFIKKQRIDKNLFSVLHFN